MNKKLGGIRLFKPGTAFLIGIKLQMDWWLERMVTFLWNVPKLGPLPCSPLDSVV